MIQPNSSNDPGRQVRTRIMTLLAQALREQPTDANGGRAEPLFLRLCRVFVQASGAAGGALTLAPNDLHRVTLCSTDDIAARLENLQEVIGEGPVADAAGSDQPVTAELGAAIGDRRWPVLSATVAEELGALIVHAFPIRVGTEPVGVVSVYRHLESSEWKPQLEEASFLAEVIGSAITSSGLDADDGMTWDVRDRISQATGMVVAQLGISPPDAAALLRAAAFSAELELGQIATEILEYRLDFSTDQNRGGDDR